jgi:hypothetical protein
MDGMSRQAASASDLKESAARSSVCSQPLDKFEMYSRRLPVFASGDAVVALEFW